MNQPYIDIIQALDREQSKFIQDLAPDQIPDRKENGIIIGLERAITIVKMMMEEADTKHMKKVEKQDAESEDALEEWRDNKNITI